MSAATHSYSQQLLLALRLHDVPGPRIAEALAEVESYVLETGQTELEAFGEPKEYAAKLARELGTSSDGSWTGLWRELRWWHALVGIGSYGGSTLLVEGVLGLSADHAATFGLPALLATALGALVLGALAVAFVLAVRRNADPVRDPRTGVDLTPPAPRLAVVALVGAPLALVVVAIVVTLIAGTG